MHYKLKVVLLIMLQLLNMLDLSKSNNKIKNKKIHAHIYIITNQKILKNKRTKNVSCKDNQKKSNKKWKQKKNAKTHKTRKRDEERPKT